MKISRRNFSLGILGLGLTSCNLDKFFLPLPKSKIYGPESERGHILRDGLGSEVEVKKIDQEFQVIILGAGISGLTALKNLYSEGIKDVLLLELGANVGGNSRFGGHEYGEYPWGAHYLPIPNKSNVELINFLNTSGAISNFDNEGRPFYKEEYLIHAPDSRLFRYGGWQNGLFPSIDFKIKEEDQSKNFYELLDRYKKIKTIDGLLPFSIPIHNSSKDSRLLKLDNINGESFLFQEGIKDPKVHWYCDYVVRDDYGTSLKEVSAWALLHYFLSRNPYKANNTEQDVLTWPEGNGWLVKKLVSGLESTILCDNVVLSVKKNSDKFIIKSYLIKDSKIIERKAKSIICALPQFVASKVLDSNLHSEIPVAGEYNPWVVSNLILKSDENYDLPWDSVNYHSKSLGFVRANHQDLYKKNKGSILTHYNAYVDNSSMKSRMELYTKSNEELLIPALQDLKVMYPKLLKEVEEVRLWIWAHAMRKVNVGSMSGIIKNNSSLKKSNGFYYAHTDASCISIFEEAFYMGLNAARNVIKYLKS